MSFNNFFLLKDIMSFKILKLAQLLFIAALLWMFIVWAFDLTFQVGKMLALYLPIGLFILGILFLFIDIVNPKALRNMMMRKKARKIKKRIKKRFASISMPPSMASVSMSPPSFGCGCASKLF